MAILATPVDATTGNGDQDCVIIARDAEVNKQAISFDAGADQAAEQAAQLAALAGVGIIAR